MKEQEKQELIMEREKKDSRISFRVYCKNCDFERDFSLVANEVDDINEAMDSALQIAEWHAWRTRHNVDVKVVYN